MRWIGWLVVAGCGASGGTTGDTDTVSDTGGDADSDSDTDTDADADADADADTDLALTASNVVAVCDYSSYGTAGPTDLAATADPGVAHVGQAEIAGNCCDPWIVDAVSPGPFTVDVTITQDVAATQCDCVCGWTLSWDLSPLDPGTWTLTAGGQETVVTVP